MIQGWPKTTRCDPLPKRSRLSVCFRCFGDILGVLLDEFDGHAGETTRRKDRAGKKFDAKPYEFPHFAAHGCQVSASQILRRFVSMEIMRSMLSRA